MKARDNPFSAGRTESLSYRHNGMSTNGLLLKFRQLDYKAAIIGPKGSGKTTLLEELKRGLEDNGFIIHCVFVNDEKPLSKDARKNLFARLKKGDIVILDGADLLSKHEWRRFKSKIVKCAGGLLITSHRQDLLATLIECSTSPELFSELASHLAVGESHPSEELLNKIYAEHKGNIRNCFRHLYDMYADKQPAVNK